MPQSVGRNPLLGQRRLLYAGRPNVLLQNVLESRPGHEIAPSVLEESRSLWLAADFKPITYYRGSLFPQWKNPLSAAFAQDVNARLSLGWQAGQVQADQLRDTQATRKRQMKHRPDAQAGPGTRFRSFQHGRDLS